MNKKCNVAILAEYPLDENDLISKGGVINAVYWLIEGMRNHPMVNVFVLSPCKDIKEKIVQKDNIQIIYFRKIFSGFDSIFLYNGLFLSVSKYLKRIKPDIIHAQGYPDVITVLMRLHFNKVVTIHGIFENEYKVGTSNPSFKEKITMKIGIALERWYTKKMPNVISISPEIETLIKSRNSNGKIFTISNAIDNAYFNIHNKRAERPTILFVALIRYRKGLHILADAVKEVSKKIPELQLRVVGRTNADPEYVESIKKNHVDLIERKNIIFLGGLKQSELLEEFSKCWALCLPSFAESSPLVLSQAMAAGKPVIATRVGGIPGMVIDGKTGFLVDPSNVEQLVTALLEIISDLKKSEKMGIDAKTYAIENYSAKNVAEKTISVYNLIVNKQ